MIKKTKLFLLPTLAVMVMIWAVTGCGPVKTEQSVITYNLGTEPETLDPAMVMGTPESTVDMALFEGLTRYGPDRSLRPGIAEKWEVSPDGKKYTFHLRQGAKWTNGDPVTAGDFEFAWKRLLAAETASEYAYQLFYLKNGEKFNAGEKGAGEVGVRAVSDSTLEVELEAPVPYFLGLTALSNLFPLNKKAVESNPNWHAGPETLVSNGPFKLVNWVHQQKLELIKNPTYWDASKVKLDKLVITTVESEDTALTMFKNKEIDIAEMVPLQEVKKLLAEGAAVAQPDPSTYYYAFNTGKKPFDDVRVRRAFTLALDRKAIVDNITQAGERPATAFVPFGFPDKTPDKDFREAGGSYLRDNDVETARKLLAEAGYPEGKGLPEIEILYNTSDSNKKIAEAVSQMWTTGLGAKVKLVNQEWGVYLEQFQQGNFQVVRIGWVPDYGDAMTFLDAQITDGSGNVSAWSNAEYDRLINAAKQTGNPAVRVQAMHDAEKILMDELPVMPIYFYVRVNMYQPYVQGVFVPVFGGYQEFKWAEVRRK